MSICIIYIVALKNRAGEWLPDPTSAIATRKINGRHAIFGKKDSPLPHPPTHTHKTPQNARANKQSKTNKQNQKRKILVRALLICTKLLDMLKLPINHMHCYSTLSRLCKLHFCCFLYDLKPSHLGIHLATLLFTHLKADIISVQ